LIRETTENESANEGYRFGQEEETYNIVAVRDFAFLDEEDDTSSPSITASRKSFCSYIFLRF
jgi:hypothetical protein